MARSALYVNVVNAAGAGVVLLAIGRVIQAPAEPAAVLLAALAVVAGVSVLRLRAVTASFSLGDAFTFSALFLYGPDVGTLAVALETLAISTRIGGTPRRVFFNTAAPCLAMWCAGTAVFQLAGIPRPHEAVSLPWVVLSVSLTVSLVFALGSGFVAAAVALHEGRSIRHVWRQHFAPLWTAPALGGYFGALVATFTHDMGVSALIALLPIPIIVHQTFRATMARAEDQFEHLRQIHRMYESTVEAFATAVDAKDAVTHGHIRRVQICCLGLAEELGVTDNDTLRALEAAALLHDVGKIATPEHILNKPGKLTPPEWEEMKKHAAIGADILAAAELPFPVVPVVRHHHENWDGTGYPTGIGGTDIPIGARILMVVDCFDALTSDRPYRAAMTLDEAFAILRERRGTMYDPVIVDTFMRIQPRLATLVEHANASAPARPSRAA